MQILKLDQVNVGSSTLDTRELPEEPNCCEEAWEKSGRTDYEPEGCKAYYNYLNQLIR